MHRLRNHCSGLGVRLLALSAIAGSAGAQYIQQTHFAGTGGIGLQWQGSAVAVSADGNTVLVAAPEDNSGIGAAWVFTRAHGLWSQQSSKLLAWDPQLPGPHDPEMSVALSADGNTALIGHGGATWAYVRVDGKWQQQGSELVGSGGFGTARQGWAVALSADGNTALVGGPGDGSIYSPNGAAWVFTRTNGVWSQQGPKLVSTETATGFGDAVALSADGNTALIGTFQVLDGPGGAWVFTRNNGAWTQQGPKLVGTGAVGNAREGSAAALSADGNVAVIGGPYDGTPNMGAAWVFVRKNGVWAQQGGKLVGSGAVGASLQGTAVAISADGNTIISPGYMDNNAMGAVWVFTQVNGVWSQQGEKFTATGVPSPEYLYLGHGIALSANADTLVAGGFGDNDFVGTTCIFVQPAHTLTALTSSPPQVSAGESVTLTASTVAPNEDLAGPPDGTVRFSGGAGLLPASFALLAGSGAASYTMALPAGVRNFSVQFTPSDNLHLPSTGTLTLNVSRGATQTTLAAALSPQTTLTATVSSGVSSPVLSGTVSFVDTMNNAILATEAVSAGTARLVLPTSAAASTGAHTIQAVYSGDANFVPSSSHLVAIPLVINAAGGNATVCAPDEFVTLFGYQLADGTAQAPAPFATSLGGVTVTVTDSVGVTRAALLSYVSPVQINFVVPDGTALGSGSVTINRDGVNLLPIPVSVGAVSPGLLTADGSGRGPALAQVVRVNADGSQTLDDAAPGILFGAGPVYLILYGTGIRHRSDPARIVCYINGVDLPVDYAGTQPQYPGLDQVNVRLPASLSGAGQVNATLTVDGIVSNAVTLTFP